MWVWASLKPGMAKAPWRSILLCFGRGALEDFGVGAGEDDAVAGDAEGLDALRCGVVVDGVEADAGEDVAVVVDGVAALGVGGGEDAEEAEQCSGLHVDEFRIVPQFEVRDRSFRKADFAGTSYLDKQSDGLVEVRFDGHLE